ncbi:MAG: ABC transporter permease [Deltaproteobacteria bacterium]|nr:ABC transporter permease [Deltaproteobacteria bacterium]
MLKNYILTALRSLKRNKLYSAINIFGLSVGLTIFILALTLSSFHFSFDKFHKDSDRIYIVLAEKEAPNGILQKDSSTYLPLAGLMEQNLPEIENATVVREYFREIFRYKENILYEDDVLFTEPNFFKVFTYPVINGDKENPLAKPNSIVLTKSTALKYFGKENPIGKTMEANFSETPLKVTAIVKDCPMNTSKSFDMLVSLPESFNTDWGTAGSTYTFVKLKKGVDADRVKSKFPVFVESFLPLQRGDKINLSLFPLEDIHLKSIDFMVGFDITALFQFYLIIGIATGLLVIVVVNFIILSTSRYSNQAKEVGVRKVVGASKEQLIYRYVSESVILSFLALFLAFMLYEIAEPLFESIIGTVDLSLWHKPLVVSITICLTFFVGVVSGIYPAFILSALKPGIILKNQYTIRKSGGKFRKGLVIFQFAIAFIMIVFTLSSTKQLDMLAKVDLGYNRKNIITVQTDFSSYTKFDLLENELKKNSNISMVASAHYIPVSWDRREKVRVEGASRDGTENINSYPCGYNFIESLDIKIVKGRSFSREFNDQNSIIVTEEAARHFGWDDPIGKTLIINDLDDTRKKVIGVAKDFHFPHVFFRKVPAMILFEPEQPFYVYIKTLANPDKETIKFLEETWQKILPDLPFEYSTLDYEFEENLRNTTKIIEIFKYIAGVSVFIACLGLFALASYTAERRTKEIGIRKVHGASIIKITSMLLSDFLLLVLVANIIALPGAYYLSEYFINVGWVYKTDLSVSLFIIAVAVSFVSALFAITVQSVKAAQSNPVEALRYE